VDPAPTVIAVDTNVLVYARRSAPSCQRRVHDRVLLDDELPRIEQIAHRVVQLVGRRT
jgi:hypothetical protein